VLECQTLKERRLENPRSEGNVRWEGFELDIQTGELRRANEKAVRLSDKPLRILIALVERPGELVTREDLRKRLWPNDTVVEFEHAIDAAMNRLRQTLRDSAENPKFIETLARRGYRWKVPVEWETPRAPAPGSPREGSLTGKRVSHYRVLEILGGGGMGVVYKGEDLKLGRRVALKFLPEELAGDAAAMQRFEREARAASALNHPNICTIYAIEEHEGQPFIAMELLEGRSLRDFIAEPDAIASPARKAPLQIKGLVEIAIQIANGLEAAHQKGIIHRDIKPANVFLTKQGQAKILDFGLAKLHEFEPVGTPPQTSAESGQNLGWNPLLTLTRTGVTIGTAAYMSPEQVRGEPLDSRTDLFSFGLVLYEMATRQRAFAGDTAAVLHHAILNQTPVPVRSLNPRIPGKLEAIINKAIEKDVRSRYQTASEMRLDLEELLQARHARRSVTGGAVLAVISCLAGAVWLVMMRPRAPNSSLEVRFRQLTTNAPENRVLDGAISPDGKYLVYSDLKGMHVKLMQTGETRSIPQPKALVQQGVDWEVVAAWLPNGTQVIANAHEPGRNAETWTSKGTSVWLVSVLGGAPKKLRDEAMAYSVSPGGSHIFFGTKKRGLFEGEIWLMNTDGTRAEKFLEADTEGSVCCLVWPPRGERIVYVSFMSHWTLLALRLWSAAALKEDLLLQSFHRR
jgi:serine/threonine protein kinase